MLIDVWRNGSNVGQIRDGGFFSLALTDTVNAVTTLTLSLPNETCVIEQDQLYIYDTDVAESKAFLGAFEVKRALPTNTADNQLVMEITADCLAGLLGCVAIPTESIITGATVGEMFSRIATIATFQTGQAIQINAASGEDALPATGIVVQVRDGLGAIRDICSALGMRWRCRPELGAVVEYGYFGAVKAVEIRESLEAKDIDSAARFGLFIAESSRFVKDIYEKVDAVVVEGGKYSLSDGSEVPLTLRLADPIPGFTITATTQFGQTYYWMKRTSTTTPRCWKPITVPNIVPEGSPPSPDQEKAAANTLAYAASQYLLANNATLYNATPTVPMSMSGEFVVGDKITYAWGGLNCNSSFQGLLFAATHKRTWAADNSVRSEVELSTRLESLTDPLSQDYGLIAQNRRVIDSQQSFQVCGLANPNVIIPFGTIYASAPTAVALQDGVTTVTIVSITPAQIELSAAPFPATVCAQIYPP